MANIADHAADLRWMLKAVEPTDMHGTFVGVCKRTQRPDESGLSCAIVAEESEHFTPTKLEVNALECRRAAKGFGQPLDVDG